MHNEVAISLIQNTSRKARGGIPRPVEFVVALLGLIAFAPLIALAAVAVAIESRGSVFFKQSRVGLKGRLFVFYKLRTMSMGSGGIQVTAGDDSRITRIGRVLRKTKLDELPSVWNVLIGDMSLVGPRPEVPEYVDLKDAAWLNVLEARPGITDPVTISLRNEESLMSAVKGDRERFYVDILQPYKLKGYIDYLRERTWRSDVKVLLRTVRVVLSPRLAPPVTLGEILGAPEETSTNPIPNADPQLTNTEDRNTTQSERRDSPRLAARWNVVVAGKDGKGSSFTETSMLENLSSKGVYLTLSRRIEVGTILNLLVQPPSEREYRIECASEVVRVETLASKTGVAMKFNAVQTHSRLNESCAD